MLNFQPITFLLIFFFVCERLVFRPINAIGDLRVAYQWKEIEYDWMDYEVQTLFPDYKKEDNLPLGFDVSDNRIFVTVPRWKRGVAASLNYINLNDTRESPPLKPYPSWEAHGSGNDSRIPELVSPFRLRVDHCSRLWVLDTGLVDILGEPSQRVPPTLLIYDLNDDKLLRKFVIPNDQRTADSFFANIVVEDYNCNDTYSYLGDLGAPGLVVYSWKLDKSWLVKHHYFHPDPKNGNFNVSGVLFDWKDGIFGMSLSPTQDGYSILYFHPLSSIMEFSVSTKLLRDPERVNEPESFHEFQALGSRGLNSQSSVSIIDPKTGVMFYALPNYNAIACWRPKKMFNLTEQGIVYANNADRNGNIWILSDRLQNFMYAHLDPNDYNYRILVGSTKDLIVGTVCSKDCDDSMNNPNNCDMRFVDTNELVPEMQPESELNKHNAGVNYIPEKLGLLIVAMLSLHFYFILKL
ncbi:hypothetical protein M0802_011376 [Mischocyttarus mexicanus]|nr:hypothetical protein M0802_011376 [Mischocyttarus mexicanus]